MLQISSIWQQDDCVFVSESKPTDVYLSKTRGALHLAKFSPGNSRNVPCQMERLFSIRSKLAKLCSSRKNPYPPQVRSSEIPRGRGLLKAKILEAKHDAKLEFPGGGGGECKTKNLPCGEYRYFLELHNLIGRSKNSHDATRRQQGGNGNFVHFSVVTGP